MVQIFTKGALSLGASCGLPHAGLSRLRTISTGTKKKSFKAALALGGGLFTVGLMAAMMEGEDGPPADVVDGVQSTMNSIVDKAGVTVAAAAAAVGEVLKSSLGGVLNTTPKPKAAKKKAKKTAKKRTASKAAKKERKRAAKAARRRP